MWINFKNATKWQAEGIFKCFFPSAPLPADPTSSSTSTETKAEATSGADKRTQQGARSGRKQHVHGVPLLSAEELECLAKKFAEAIPEDEMSVASLQGYLLKNKVCLLASGVRLCGVEPFDLQTRPRECVEEVHEWVKTEREMRKKLKEKEEVLFFAGAIPFFSPP